MVYQKSAPGGDGSSPQQFECHICHAKLRYATTLRKHLRTHLPAELECPRCGKKYHFQYQVQEHLRACRWMKRSTALSRDDEITIGSDRMKLEMKQVDPLTEGLEEELEDDQVVVKAGESLNSSREQNMKLEISRKSGDKPNEKTRTDCTICKRKFVSRFDLRKHIRSFHGTKCPKCPAFLTSANSLRYHQNFHKGIRPYECRIEGCKSTFSSPGNRKMHEASCRKAHMTCHTCGEEFKLPLDLHEHARVCSSSEIEMLDEDEVMNEQELQQSELKTEIETDVEENSEHEEAAESEDKKPEVTKVKTEKQHSTSNRFECEICPASFQNKTSLRYHSYWHEDIKPYPCRNEGCPEAFTHPQLRADHEQPCRGEISVCPVCRVELKRNSLLRHHMKQFHRGVKLEQIASGEVDLEQLQAEYQRTEEKPSEEFAEKTVEEFLEVERDEKGRERLFRCRVCPAVLRNRKTFKYHVNIHMGLKPYRCREDGCAEAFHSPQTRCGHEEKCRGDSLACPVCDKMLAGKKMLGRHIRMQHKDDPRWLEELAERERSKREELEEGRSVPEVMCELCSKVFQTKPALKYHLNMHYGKKPYKCRNEGCEEAFYSPQIRVSHEQPCRKEVSICPHCGARLKRKDILKKHIDRYHGEKCVEKNEELLDSMIELDTGSYQELLSASKSLEEVVEEPVRAVETVCEEDPRVVEVSLQVARRKSRSRRRTIACQLCPAVLQSKPTYEYHMNEHNGLTPYKCRNEGCDEAFPSPQKRLAHEEPCQGKIFPCDECGAVLMRSYLLRKHIENCHSGPTGAAAVRKNSIKQDMSARLKRFMCKLCLAVFHTKEGFRLHMNGHTGKKPFVCRAEGCEEGFVNPRQRILHEKGVHGDLSVCPKCGEKVKKYALLAKHMAQCDGGDAKEWKMEVVEFDVDQDDIIEEVVGQLPEDDEQGSIEYLEEELVSNRDEEMEEILSDSRSSSVKDLQDQPVDEMVTEALSESLLNSAEDHLSEDCPLDENPMVIHEEPKSYPCRNKGCISTFEDTQTRFAHETSCRKQTTCRCELCDIELASKQALKRHVAFKHPEHATGSEQQTSLENQPELVCNVCQTAFSSKDGFRYHMNSHRGAEPYMCRGDNCEERFVNPTKRHTHEKQRHGDLYVCPDCGAKFKRVDTRKRHMLHGCNKGGEVSDRELEDQENVDGTVEFLEEKDDALDDKALVPLDDKAMEERQPDLAKDQGGASKSFWCRLCPAVLHSVKTFKYHLNEHTGAKPYACRNEGCAEAFASPQKRSVHEEPCRGQTSSCPYCGLEMKRKAILVKHIAQFHKSEQEDAETTKTGKQMPSAAKTFLCEQCSAVLQSAKTYQYHMNTHYGRTPFQCRNAGCTQAFVSPSARAVHEQPCRGEVVKCRICDAQLINSRSLQIHMARTHPEELARERERNEASRRSCRDPAVQQYCYESSVKPDARRPVRQQVDKQDGFSCEICSAVLRSRQTLQYHMNGHTGDKPFVCREEGCNKGFSGPSGRVEHEKHCPFGKGREEEDCFEED